MACDSDAYVPLAFCLLVRSNSCFMQGYMSGKVKSEPLVAAILKADPSSRSGQTSVAWQCRSHKGAVKCLLAHRCKIYNESDQEIFPQLLISGCTDGIISAANADDGGPVFTLNLHTDEVCIATEIAHRHACLVDLSHKFTHAL